MNNFKKLLLHMELLFLKLMQRIRYSYYLRNYPLYLRKIGVKFSGDIKKTGFIASSAKFDSYTDGKYITIGEETIISTDCLFLVHDYSIATAIRGN